MSNSFIIVLSIVILILVIFSFIGYMFVTNKIIREQEKEIAGLKTQLKRERQRERLQVVTDGRHPKFGGF